MAVSYLLGNILTADIVTKLKHNVDIRAEGSGKPGTRNMGRVYGKGYFVATFLGDAIKGAIVVSIAKYLFEDFTFVMLTLLAVIMGHIYPMLFKGKGGKGISTFIGGLIAFDYLIALTLVAVFIIFYLIFKGFTKPGLITIACLPLCMILYSYSIVTTILSALIIVLILYVNHE
ncbi:glycerol-3-phosphate 1-O-acyltransferase PlsY [Bacillus anthracis]|uniref:glycerol-3-phosphate 1-O-acyltransferase PlsY n=1 Tax=Bacillus anthracis TaxID=1392 RepID=UPI00094A5586|nr:glycerol-3-phosphate 1-O-acyltransferase PlsY [Bacillus anthracis]APT25935.1 glycerol-3-phosphate acyltransferase [Bacillus anthracis]AQM46392.1 glycerol-3-phosphate acyltransferase [Bacillus anthracis]OON46369.1 glycerol-3-phosphate acyltransferase [Bacillus anthracis]